MNFTWNTKPSQDAMYTHVHTPTHHCRTGLLSVIETWAHDQTGTLTKTKWLQQMKKMSDIHLFIKYFLIQINTSDIPSRLCFLFKRMLFWAWIISLHFTLSGHTDADNQWKPMDPEQPVYWQHKQYISKFSRVCWRFKIADV